MADGANEPSTDTKDAQHLKIGWIITMTSHRGGKKSRHMEADVRTSPMLGKARPS
jgi:hypothetical protein